MRMCGVVSTSVFLCSNGGLRWHPAIFDAGEFTIEFCPQENPGSPQLVKSAGERLRLLEGSVKLIEVQKIIRTKSGRHPN